MSAVLDDQQRNRLAKEVYGSSLTPEIQQYLLVAFVSVLLLTRNPQLFEELEISLSPDLLHRFREIDPNFNPGAYLQELSVLGTSAIIDLVLKQAWGFVEVTKENDSFRSRKEAFEVLLERERDKVERLRAELAANEHKVEEYLQKISALEKEIHSAKDASKYKQDGTEDGTESGGNDGTVSNWKRIADELQSQFKEKEMRHKEELVCLEQTVADLRKQHEKWETSCQQNRSSRLVNALETELTRTKKELSGSREQVDTLTVMCKQSEIRIEELMMELSRLKSQVSEEERQREAKKTLDISAILKENSNLRAALKTVEQMKMEVENEKVAVQDQLLEYQRRCGVFDKPAPPIATFKTGSNRTGLGKARAFADGIVRGTLAPSPRACPFCKAEFAAGQLGRDENEFMDHVHSCQGGLSASEIH